MSTLPINAVPRDKGVIYHSMSLFYNKTHSKSRYRPLPEKRGFQFMKLPAELRNTIWGLTIEQRLVEVRFAQYEELHNHVTHDFVADVPVALHICQESRNFALGHYELTFDHDGTFAPVYFNFKLDILYPRASCSKEQLRFLANNMDKKDCDRVTYLAMYNEHLERTRSLSTWRALPLRFHNLDAFIILFKSFVDPTTVDEETLPLCKYSSAWESFCGEHAYTPTGRIKAALVQHDSNDLEKRIRAYLQPPVHVCEREKTQKGHSRQTHFLGGKIMRRDPMHSHGWAMEKAHYYSKNLHKAANGSRWVWRCPEIAVLGFCEHGLEFEEAPGLAYKGKFFRHFDDQNKRVKKFYIPGTVTGTVKSQKAAEEIARIEARSKAKIKARKKAERDAEKKRGWR